ncbi:MAG: alpha/beta fold hydrolase [Propionibacteriaceae bacterium]|jgi:pimeloyl-ACP methyl ester carboxylesterase|nr:alpha/beta fold hydrolase [Propionibacteriaceae bacterium]
MKVLKSLRRLPVAAVAAGFAVESRIAPASAAKQAAKLWCRLPGNAGRRMDNRPRPGRRLQVEAAIGLRDTTTRTRLNTELWGDEAAPIVYLVHGWGGWHGQLGAFVEPLLARGFQVIGFDAASHGYSAPGEYGANLSSSPEIRRSFQAVVREFGQPHGIIAHSLGCAVVAAALLEDVTTTNLALVAPSPDMVQYLTAFGRKLRLSAKAMEQLRPQAEAWSGESLERSDPAVLARLGHDRLPPALIVHDRLDKEVRFKTAQTLADAWPGAELFTTEGLGHHRILKDPQVVARVAAEMGENL